MSDLSSEQIRALDNHLDLLLRWNKVLNLSAIRDPNEIRERHFSESLFLASHIPPGVWSIADLGSGGGFPGIPVAIARPESHVTLVESHARKSVFLREVSREMRNISVLNQRVESVNDHYDWIISRGVNLVELAGWITAHAGGAILLAERPELNGFVWQEPIPLPNGENRFLEIGRNVSRETFVG